MPLRDGVRATAPTEKGTTGKTRGSGSLKR